MTSKFKLHAMGFDVAPYFYFTLCSPTWITPLLVISIIINYYQ
jgi:hypothetical protein